jgi:hypothetical protein
MDQPGYKRHIYGVLSPGRDTEFVFPNRQRTCDSKQRLKNDDQDHCQMDYPESEISNETPSQHAAEQDNKQPQNDECDVPEMNCHNQVGK